MLVSMTAGLMAAVGHLGGIPYAAADSGPCKPGVGCFFLSPSGNISCELDEAAPPGTQGSAAVAYCQSNTPTQSVRLDADGTVAPCTGVSCMGDPPLGVQTLPYGQTASHGPYACVSQTEGMTCTVASGRGFTISRSGIAKVG
jgi:hypothetical protein